MITYVESNFVLQLALGQEEARYAEAVLKLAEKGLIRLVFPAFSLSEPFSTVAYRGVERGSLYNPLQTHLTQLQRSGPRSEAHQQVVDAIRALLSTWKEITKRETGSLQSTVQRLLSAGESIGIDSAIFREAVTYQGMYGFSIQDAVVYASVIADLQRRPHEQIKCFISSNSKDFNDPGITAELESYNCRYYFRFSAGLSFIERNLA